MSRRAETVEKRVGKTMIPVKKEAIAKEKIEPYFEEWVTLSKEIYEAHDQRSGHAQQLMEKGIQLFEQLIISTSETEEKEILSKEEYEVMPINGMERLQFIKARPGQYACYIQLDELFKELKKKYARLRIQK